jgi:hypothetical protein
METLVNLNPWHAASTGDRRTAAARMKDVLDLYYQQALDHLDAAIARA